MTVHVISLGGSIVVPQTVDTDFLIRFRELLIAYLDEYPDTQFILVVGGGKTARNYQEAFVRVYEAFPRESPVKSNTKEILQDWIGIAATRLNAELMRAVLAGECPNPVLTNPDGEVDFQGRILIAAGWKPGFSTDYDAVLLAERFKAVSVINLSNVAQVYDSDPRENPNAKALNQLSWQEFQRIVGTKWEPGKNVPFDPIATQRAMKLKLQVVFAAGRDLDAVSAILHGKPFLGTRIGPE